MFPVTESKPIQTAVAAMSRAVSPPGAISDLNQDSIRIKHVIYQRVKFPVFKWKPP